MDSTASLQTSRVQWTRQQKDSPRPLFFFFLNLFFIFFILLLLLLLLLLFLGPIPLHMEVPRLGVESEL